MARVCLGAESQKETHVSKHRLDSRFSNKAESIALSAMYAANHLDSVKAIVTLTESGSTAKLMSRISSGLPIYSLSRHASTLGQTALYRGVYPEFFDSTKTEKDGMVKAALDTLVSQGSLHSGDTVIITHGDSMETVGATNTMKIVTVA
jgi:pyruvate kinase